MPSSPAKRRAQQRRYYEDNKEKCRERVRRTQADRRALIAELKNEPCADCGGKFPAVCMDWHHRDPATKDRTFHRMTSGLERFHAEIAKCDLLCANCHRIRHYS